MNYKLYYCPIPFRRNFIRLLLEEANEKYSERTSEEVVNLGLSSSNRLLDDTLDFQSVNRPLRL